MPVTFTEATTEGLYARIALIGASGSGKTYTALKIAAVLGKRVCVIDTERNSARIFAQQDGVPKPYFVYNLKRCEPQAYIMCVDAAAAEGFDVCIVDSTTPEWNGTGGILDIADANKKATGTGWKIATPEHEAFMHKLTGYNDRMHVIATARSKMEYVMETNPLTGRLEVRKMGMAPLQRDTFVYEWDLVGSMDTDHNITFSGVGKERMPALADQTFHKPGAELGQAILAALRGAPTEV